MSRTFILHNNNAENLGKNGVIAVKGYADQLNFTEINNYIKFFLALFDYLND